MKLRRIHVRRMPGIDRPFALEEFRDGVNLVVGPNGSGKTTIVRALRATLWPAGDGFDGIGVDSHWVSGGDSWVARRDGERIAWQRNGREGAPPAIPDQRAARCFFLGMADLMVDPQRSDPGIAMEIRRQMAGGYDVPQVIRELFTLRPRHGQAEELALRRARADLAELRAEQAALADREDQLERLELEREAARKARAELQLLDRASELADARLRADLLEAELARYPAGLERMQGDETRRLAELREQLEEVERRARSCGVRIDAAHAVLERESADRREIDAVELEAFLHRTRDLQAHEAVIQEASRDLAAAVARLDRAARLLDPSSSQRSPELTRSDLRELDLLLREVTRLESERGLVEAELELIESARPARSSEELRRGLDLLHEWDGLSVAGVRNRRLHRLALSTALLAVAGGVGGLIHPVGWSVALLALGALAGAAAGIALSRPASSLVQVRRRYEALGLDLPRDRSVEAIRAMRATLQVEWDAARRSEQQLERRRTLEVRLVRLRGLADQLDERRREFAALIGSAADSRELELVLVARELLARQEAEADCADARARLREAGGCQEESLDAIRSYLERYGREGVVDEATALACLSDLQERARLVAEAREKIGHETTERVALEPCGRALVERIDALFREAGIEAGDEAELDRRAAQLEGYRRSRSELEQCRLRIAELRQRLADRSDLLGASRERIADLRIAAERQAESLDGLAETIGSIRRAVETARSSRRFEEQVDRLNAAERRLDERREETLLARAGCFLLGQVRAEYDENARPEVLRRAADLFRRFTRHQYRLDLDAEVDPPAFRALETRSGIGRSLDELSDGTRLQLLLAARLAFAGYLDPHNEVPLVLDEVLTTSDPARFLAVAESLRLIAADEGRQVLYLTSNPADAAMWNQVLDEAGESRLDPIDLARVRRLADVVQAGQLVAAPVPAPPAPGDLSPEEYGVRLEVPQIDPSGPADSIHLFYLLRDELLTLEALLREGIETVGQARYLVDCGEARRLFGDDMAARLAGLVELADSFLAAWRIGRGRRLDETGLRKAGTTETFLPRLREIVEQVEGDASRFLDILEQGRDPRTRRLRTSRRAELREQLIAEGYLDERRVLEEPDLLARVLGRLAGRIGEGHLGRDEVRHRVHELFDQAGRGSPRASVGK